MVFSFFFGLIFLELIYIQWPGLSIPPEGFKAVDKNGVTVRRGELGVLVATRIAKLIIDTQRGYPLVSFGIVYFNLKVLAHIPYNK